MADDSQAEYRRGVEAEQSVIGSMLVDPRCVGEVIARLREEDFQDSVCRNAFIAVKNQFLSNGPVDPVIICEKLGGGTRWSRWVRDILALTPTAANIDAYVGLVRDLSTLSRLHGLAGELMVCPSADEARALVRRMSGLMGGDVARMPRFDALDLANNFYNRLGREAVPDYLPWGIPAADACVYAQRGDFILLGGYPSAGKTLLSIQMALAQARKYKVVYYTLETQPEKMADRLFAYLAQVPLEKIKTHGVDEAEMTRLARAAADFSEQYALSFVQAAGASVDEVAADAISQSAEIIYIDYLQLLEAPGRDRYSKVTEISRGLKVFCQSHGVAVVALAQLSRPERQGRGAPPPPSMQSFRESGQLEQDADVAFLLWAEDPTDNRSRRVLKLAKNKEGRRFVRAMDFDGSVQTMTENPGDYMPGGQTSVAADLAGKGKAVKSGNRAASLMQQVQFQGLPGDDADNPFAF